MLQWRFSTYVQQTGKTEVQKDIDRLGEAGLARFRAQVKYLAATTGMKDWSEPKAKKLKGGSGLYEIKFQANNNATRAIGFFGPDSDEFTILIICNHKGNVYKPADAIQTAAARKQHVLKNIARRDPLQIDGEDFPPPDEA